MFAMIDLTEPDADARTRAPRSNAAPAPLRPQRAPASEGNVQAWQPAWDASFRAEADRLERAFAPLLPFIEHVGATSIPGCAARPIIDIAVGVGRPAAARFMVETLRGYGYRYDDTPPCEVGQYLFVRHPHGVPTHHVHVVEHGGAAWDALLRFRDVLRTNGRLAREYELLRRRFAGVHPANRLAHARAKTIFISSVLRSAA